MAQDKFGLVAPVGPVWYQWLSGVIAQEGHRNRTPKVEQRVGDFNSQCLSNTAWAFATAEVLDAPLLVAMSRAVKTSAT